MYVYVAKVKPMVLTEITFAYFSFSLYSYTKTGTLLCKSAMNKKVCTSHKFTTVLPILQVSNITDIRYLIQFTMSVETDV